MLVINSSSELIQSIKNIKKNNNTIAFVPTMGNLHKGHLNLISMAQHYADIVIVSIFVNPLQFNQIDDLKKYPRTLDADIDQCNLMNVDIVFVPSEKDIYPDNQDSGRIELTELAYLSNILEGASRPDHFTGVVTIVKMFFELIQPDYAIFGEKDFQQLQIIQKMVEVLNLSVKIISSQTTREINGLAMSSRNNNLSEAERDNASNIFSELNYIQIQIKSGEKDFAKLINNTNSRLSANGFRTDYLVICDCVDLAPATAMNSNELIILIAVWLGSTRLIDNLRIKSD